MSSATGAVTIPKQLAVQIIDKAREQSAEFTGVNLEWGYTQDGFQRMIKALRIYIRCDLGVTNESGISLVTATT